MKNPDLHKMSKTLTEMNCSCNLEFTEHACLIENTTCLCYIKHGNVLSNIIFLAGLSLSAESIICMCMRDKGS